MSVPLLGDLSLEYVQQIEHWHDSGFVATRIAGLAGELQQNAGRLSHRIRIQGILFGDTAADALKSMQQAALDGAELTFSADITSALDLQKVVITSLRAVEAAGQQNRFSYALMLAESPPLPPPAEISGFGGLDDFGLGDLGFDTDILGDLQDLAGEVSGAIDAALDVIDQLSALANLANLDALQVGNFMAPITRTTGEIGELASKFKDAARGLGDLLG
jgi:HAMP domain-containing protein